MGTYILMIQKIAFDKSKFSFYLIGLVHKTRVVARLEIDLKPSIGIPTTDSHL